jgi:hypothetical protein
MAEFEVVFDRAGPLGLGLASHAAHEPLIVTEVVGMAAVVLPPLRPGLRLVAVQGQPVSGLAFDQVLHLIRVAGRPLTLAFKPDLPAGGEGADVLVDLAATATEHAPELERAPEDGGRTPNEDPTVAYRPAQYRNRDSGGNLAHADMASLRVKIEAATQSQGPLSEVAHARRIAAAQAKEVAEAALEEKKAAAEQLSAWLAAPTGGADLTPGYYGRLAALVRWQTAQADRASAEREHLLQRVESTGRVAARRQAVAATAEAAAMEANDELQDAGERKALLETQLQLVLRGSAGALGRLVVQLPALAPDDAAGSRRWGLRAGAARLVSVFDGAQVSLRLGSTVISAGPLPPGWADGVVVPALDVSSAEAAHDAGGAVEEPPLRTFQFEVDNEDVSGAVPSLLAIELQVAAGSARASGQSRLVAVCGLDMLADGEHPAQDFWLPLRQIAASATGKRKGASAAHTWPQIGQLQLQTLFIPAQVDGDRTTPASATHSGKVGGDMPGGGSPRAGPVHWTGGAAFQDVLGDDDVDVAADLACALEVVQEVEPEPEAKAVVPQTARQYLARDAAEAAVANTAVDAWGFAVDRTDLAAWRAGAGHASCTESLQRTAWEEFFSAEFQTNRPAAAHCLLWPYCRASYPADMDGWRAAITATSFQELVAAGIPTERRGQLWLELSGAAHLRRAAGNGRYAALRAIESDAQTLKQIGKDAPRTFAGEQTAINTTSGQGVLREILLAAAAENPVVGYCQSMNLIAAHFLLQPGMLGRPEAVCWQLVAVCREVAPGYHTPDMAGVRCDLLVLNDLLGSALPDVKQQLGRLAIPVDLVAMEWLIGLFCTTGLPRHTLYRLWDLVFFHGSAVLVAMSLVCLGALETIRIETMEDVTGPLRTMLERLYDAEALASAVANTLTEQCARIDELRERYG